MRQRGPGHAKVTVDVCLERLIELFVGKVFEPFLVLLESSIVNQNIKSSEFLDGRFDSLFAKFGFGNVARDRQSIAAFLPDGFSRLGRVAFFFRKMSEDNVGAFAGKQYGDRSADSRIAARDQRYFVFQLARSFVERRFIS